MPPSGRLEWRVLDSLIAYMRKDPTFAIHVDGGARFDDDAGVVLPVETVDGIVRATGSVTLTAHDGALEVPLRHVRIEGGFLWIDDPLEDAEPPVRMRLVAVGPRDGGPSVLETRLADDAEILFSYRYPARSAFADIHLVDAVD